jgi:hypothetical protein
VTHILVSLVGATDICWRQWVEVVPRRGEWLHFECDAPDQMTYDATLLLCHRYVEVVNVIHEMVCVHDEASEGVLTRQAINVVVRPLAPEDVAARPGQAKGT